MRRRSSWFRALPAGLLLFSAAVLLVCSGTSPLYRGHDWTDANTYLTMGRSLLQGVVPYRDLFDHKGPLLYGIYALGALLHPQGFYGIFLLQVFSLAATLYALYQAARALGAEPAPSLLCVCALPFFLLSAGVYYLPKRLDYGGGSAEEFCLPLLAAALHLSAHCHAKGCWSFRALTGLGALAGAVFQIKFNLILFFAGLSAPVFLLDLFKRDTRRFAVHLGGFALGFGGSLVPYLLYGTATHSLRACWRAYFCFNVSYAQGDAASAETLAIRTLSAAWSTMCTTPILAAALLLFLLGMAALVRRSGIQACLSPLGAFSALALAIFVGQVMPYTLLPLLLSPFYGLMSLASRLPAASMRRANIPILAVGIALAAVVQNQMLFHRALAWLAPPTCQEAVAALIRSGPWDTPTLLEAGMLSRGFYNQLGLVPETYYFYCPNVSDDQHPEILRCQLQSITAAKVNYVVLQSSQPVLSPVLPPENARLAQLYQAVLQNYTPVGVIPGTGAVNHLYYHLFQQIPPTEPPTPGETFFFFFRQSML